MRALLIPTTLAALIAGAPLALAATQYSSGTFQSYDSKSMTLTLSDGASFMLPTGFKDHGLKAGERVKISWEMKNGQHVVDSVTIAR